MPKITTDAIAVDAVLDRGRLETFLPTKKLFREKLLSGERLKIFGGFDPTNTALHLGHARNLMILEDFRRLGHEAIVLFGDFTARIGDPDKDSVREQLSPEKIEKNLQKWRAQIRPFIETETGDNPAKIVKNADWLGKLTFADVVKIAANFTVQQMIERDLFSRRIAAGDPVFLHEFFYPLMQGYDSVALGVDAEVCGGDQIFNALAGRTLAAKMAGREKFVLAGGMFDGMSKSKGTGVMLDGAPADIFGQTMALPDGLIRPLLIQTTRLLAGEIDQICGGPGDPAGPAAATAKKRLAREITATIHGPDAADRAAAEFAEVFSAGGTPDEMPEILAKNFAGDFPDFLVKIAAAPSKSEARRLFAAGAVSLDGEKISAENSAPTAGQILRVGKRKFFKIA